MNELVFTMLGTLSRLVKFVSICSYGIPIGGATDAGGTTTGYTAFFRGAIRSGDLHCYLSLLLQALNLTSTPCWYS